MVEKIMASMKKLEEESAENLKDVTLEGIDVEEFAKIDLPKTFEDKAGTIEESYNEWKKYRNIEEWKKKLMDENPYVEGQKELECW